MASGSTLFAMRSAGESARRTDSSPCNTCFGICPHNCAPHGSLTLSGPAGSIPIRIASPARPLRGTRGCGR